MRQRSVFISLLLNLTVGACALCSVGDQNSSEARTSGQDIPSAILVSHREVDAHRLTPHEAIRTRGRGRFPWPQIDSEVVADANGDVAYVHVTSTPDRIYPGWEDFFPKAIELARNWKFWPSERNGKPVAPRFLEYVDIVPPEQLPATHVPFPEIRDWSKLQITLERTSCFGRCPAYKVEIHGDGSVVYTGISSVAVTGQHLDRISREALEQIVEAFRRANYFSLANEYVGCAVDCPLYRTSVSIDGQRKSVTDFGGKKVFMPDVVSDLEDSIDRIADTAKWKRGDAATVPALEKEAWDFKSTEAANTLARVATLGDADAVRELVVAGVGLSGKDEAGRGPLAAAACGDWYIGKGNDDPEAVEARDLRVIPTLLEAGAGRNNPGEMNRALMCAARGRELGPVRFLLQSGASADAADSDGTALIVAASSGVAQLVEEVLKHRPNVNARNQLGKTAIFVAAEHFAWSKDHDINYPDVIRLLAQSGADLNAQDKDGNTALHVALDLERARTLIQLGAGINILNNEGDTPLINTGSGEVAKLLLQAGADPAIRNIHGLTALDFALAHNWKDKVEALQTAQPRGQHE